jgi:hypothetical protein
VEDDGESLFGFSGENYEMSCSKGTTIESRTGDQNCSRFVCSFLCELDLEVEADRRVAQDATGRLN